jgi:hypothetical protein
MLSSNIFLPLLNGSVAIGFPISISTYYFPPLEAMPGSSAPDEDVQGISLKQNI